jgi:hypothetical protein
VQGLLPYAIALLAGGCTIQREIPLEQFACSNGGPCDAGIISPPVDSAFPDAAFDKDADAAAPDVVDPPDTGETPDSGPPLAACPKIQALQSDGLVGGDTSSEVNSYEPSCSAPGGRDVVYGFNVPGTLR